MSSTNKTTNYELSQFIGTDKPAWLTDYNQDMAKIDAGIDAAQDTATGANGKADANTTKIGDLSYLSTTAKNNLVAAVNEVDSNAETAQNTANSANSTASSALSKANTLESSLNLSIITDNLSATVNAGSITYNNLKSARNADNSIGKLYGKIAVNLANTSATSITITIPNAFDTVPASFSLNGLAFRQLTKNAGWQGFDLNSYTINTNGSVTMTVNVFSDTTMLELLFVAGVIFLKSFGDQPE